MSQGGDNKLAIRILELLTENDKLRKELEKLKGKTTGKDNVVSPK